MIGVMENSKIEQVEVERFKSLFLRGIAFIFWFPGIILMELPLNKFLMADCSCYKFCIWNLVYLCGNKGIPGISENQGRSSSPTSTNERNVLEF